MQNYFYGSEIYRVVTEDGRIIYTNRRTGSNPERRSERQSREINENLYKAYMPYIDKFSQKFNIDRNLIISIIFVESYFNERAVSHKGACGLMQLIPATADRFGVSDIFDPKENIKGGTAYLRFLFDHFDGALDLVLAGYNAGENAVKRYNGVPPFRETQNYVKRVTELYQNINKSTIYTYIDNDGRRHFTNDISKIPRGISYRKHEIK